MCNRRQQHKTDIVHLRYSTCTRNHQHKTRWLTSWLYTSLTGWQRTRWPTTQWTYKGCLTNCFHALACGCYMPSWRRHHAKIAAKLTPVTTMATAAPTMWQHGGILHDQPSAATTTARIHNKWVKRLLHVLLMAMVYANQFERWSVLIMCPVTADKWGLIIVSHKNVWGKKIWGSLSSVGILAFTDRCLGSTWYHMCELFAFVIEVNKL